MFSRVFCWKFPGLFGVYLHSTGSCASFLGYVTTFGFNPAKKNVEGRKGGWQGVSKECVLLP